MAPFADLRLNESSVALEDGWHLLQICIGNSSYVAPVLEELSLHIGRLSRKLKWCARLTAKERTFFQRKCIYLCPINHLELPSLALKAFFVALLGVRDCGHGGKSKDCPTVLCALNLYTSMFTDGLLLLSGAQSRLNKFSSQTSKEPEFH